jgi:hypothetical protein
MLHRIRNPKNKVIYLSLDKYKCQIIQRFLQIMCSSKSKINYNYESLMQKIIKSKTSEKEKIISKLDNLSDEDRKISNIERSLGLGEWGKGSGRKYTKERYDKEHGFQSMDELYDTMEKLLSKSMDEELNESSEAYDMSNIGDDGEEQYEDERMYGENDDY